MNIFTSQKLVEWIVNIVAHLNGNQQQRSVEVFNVREYASGEKKQQQQRNNYNEINKVAMTLHV